MKDFRARKEVHTPRDSRRKPCTLPDTAKEAGVGEHQPHGRSVLATLAAIYVALAVDTARELTLWLEPGPEGIGLLQLPSQVLGGIPFI